jgi:hypothetical protein
MLKIISNRNMNKLIKYIKVSKIPHVNVLDNIKQFSTSSKNSKGTRKPILSDIDLHKNYNSLISKVDAVQLLFESDQHRKLYENITAMNRKTSNLINVKYFLPSLMLYLDLQHPLLIKYGYDVFDFQKGAVEAFKQVHMAIASKDLFNYSNNFSTKSEAGELLQETLHPKLYKACIEACKEMQSRGINVCYFTVILLKY